jgi:hypothetical protein
MNPILGSLFVYPDFSQTYGDFNTGTKFADNNIYQTKNHIMNDGTCIYMDDTVMMKDGKERMIGTSFGIRVLFVLYLKIKPLKTLKTYRTFF